MRMKNKKQIISRLLWMGNIFLLIFCLAGCGTSGTGTSESGTEQQESSSSVPNYYHKGKIFLPQLIQSAETTKKAFEVVKETFTTNEGEEKGPIIIATVEGDIHDIGKNIVKVVLESYGYKIIDLGKDVKVEKVVEAYKKYKPKAIGLSALMTTTVASMERTIKALHEAGCSEPIWVGGAVVTEDIAHNIGADYYTEDAMAAVNLLENEILIL